MSIVNRDRLRFALRWADLSQAQAARNAGVHTQRITDDLAGRRPLKLAQVQSLAAVLGIDSSWLMAPSPAVTPDTPQRQRQRHPVADLMRPLQASLMLCTWGELLVLWRSLQARTHGASAIEAEVADSLLQRLAKLSGLDPETITAATSVIERLSTLG